MKDVTAEDNGKSEDQCLGQQLDLMEMLGDIMSEAL